MSLWDRFRFRKPKAIEPEPVAERGEDVPMTIDQWVQMVNNWPMISNGNAKPDEEKIANDYAGYSSGAFKASAPVFAAVATRMRIFSEARFAYQKMDKSRPGDLDYRPSLDILEEPWPNGTTGDLLARALLDVDLAGNHFMLREKVNGGRLRWLRPDWVTIVLSGDPNRDAHIDVLGYIYKPGGTEDEEDWEVYPIDGSNGFVAHWCPIPDPEAQFRGMSWLTPVIREVQGDKAISQHKLKFFENGATPNIVVKVPETVSPEKFAEFKRIAEQQYAGAKNAYKAMYLGGGADVTITGSHMDQLDFETVTGIGETRIAAAAGIHPVIAGLTQGMSGSSLNEGNFDAAKDAFASGTMRPLWRSLCAAYSRLIDVPDGYRLWFDDRDVLFLREDRQKVAQRQQIEATTISRYVMQGYTPDSARDAVLNDDISLLEHTGLYSVQLLPPNISFGTGESPTAGGGGKVSGTSGSKANNHPTGSKRQPVGRPKNPSPKAEAKSDESAWFDAVRSGEEYEED